MALFTKPAGLWSWLTPPFYPVFVLPNAWDCKQIIEYTHRGMMNAALIEQVSGGDTVFCHRIWAKCGGELNTYFNHRFFRQPDGAGPQVSTHCHQEIAVFSEPEPYLAWSVLRGTTLGHPKVGYRFAQDRHEEVWALKAIADQIKGAETAKLFAELGH